jgi:hypothetical protein
MQDAVRHEATQDLQQKPLGHLSLDRQSAARDRQFRLRGRQLDGCLNGIDHRTREFHPSGAQFEETAAAGFSAKESTIDHA